MFLPLPNVWGGGRAPASCHVHACGLTACFFSLGWARCSAALGKFFISIFVFALPLPFPPCHLLLVLWDDFATLSCSSKHFFFPPSLKRCQRGNREVRLKNKNSRAQNSLGVLSQRRKRGRGGRRTRRVCECGGGGLSSVMQYKRLQTCSVRLHLSRRWSRLLFLCAKEMGLPLPARAGLCLD